MKVSPLMQQYFSIKEQYPDALLMFQVGDFYELFFDDAKTVAQELSITLTRRGQHDGQDIPLCGVPCHNLGYHLVRLVNRGFKVAICEQIEKARPGVIVARKVTRLFTPGTLTEQGMLQDKKPSYLCAVSCQQQTLGVVFLELLTFQTFATSLPAGQMRLLENELVRFLPDEVVLETRHETGQLLNFFNSKGFPVSFAHVQAAGKTQASTFNSASDFDSWQQEALQGWFDRQFSQQVKLQLEQSPAIARSVGSLAQFLARHNRSALDQIQDISFYQPEDFLILDAATQHNLELLEGAAGEKKHSLFAVLDQAKTAMGSRMLKKWLLKPLVCPVAINARLDVVQALQENLATLFQLQDLLAQIADLERIIGRLVLERAIIADFLLLKHALQILPNLRHLLVSLSKFELMAKLLDQLQELPLVWQLLESAINPAGQGQTNPIKPGFDAELDRLRELVLGGQQQLLALEMREIAATGISSLKVREHESYGYGIEVTKSNLLQVPLHYRLQQTLVAKSRYVTDELKALEQNITLAREKIDQAEAELFAKVKSQVLEKVHELRAIAQAAATLDALAGLAQLAQDNNYCRPGFNDSEQLFIKAGRHPMVEQSPNLRFVPNNTALQPQSRLWIITGPNMGGKSTYLRQVALICILGQIGSFVPAQQANLPLLDRIFTRIGAGDNLAAGKSTFLVEMEEAATICRQATAKSLVILDEVGRGTSTFDGMAIAQAIIEFLCQTKPLCLFATHYHELTSLVDEQPGTANYLLGYQKIAAGLVFLHQLQPGCATGSFGVEVAKMADLPTSVINRAQQLVALHEAQAKIQHQSAISNSNFKFTPAASSCDKLCTQRQELLQHLRSKNPEELSPRQAHELLFWLFEQKL